MKSFAVVVALAAALFSALGHAQPRIIEPEPGATVHSNDGVIPMRVAGIAPGLSIQVLVDGQPLGEPHASNTFTLEGIDRGTHQLAVRVLDAQGREVARTEAVEVHVWQASRLFPSRRQGGQ